MRPRWVLLPIGDREDARAAVVDALRESRRLAAFRAALPLRVDLPVDPRDAATAVHAVRHRLRIRREHLQLVARLPSLAHYATLCAFDDLTVVALEARRLGARLREHVLLEQALSRQAAAEAARRRASRVPTPQPTSR